MIKKITIIPFFAVLFFVNDFYAQVISKPNLNFTQACASPVFNEFKVTFNFDTSKIEATNQFIIELSDAAGNFTNSEIIYTSAAGAINTSPANLLLGIPNTTGGQAYRIRIRSTTPLYSSTSDAFPAYYKHQDAPFTINNLVPTAAFCAGSSYLLTIDNPGSGTNDSPLKYPSLTFNWYKATSATTEEFVKAGSTLEVTEPGTYFVETNYGTCTSDSYSNRVTVNQASTSNIASINSSLGNPYCASLGETTLTTSKGDSYVWYKDGVLIENATNQTYKTKVSGVYTVTINLGTCVSTASIDLDASNFSSSIDVMPVNIIGTGETLVATVTTDAIAPTFSWYLNDVLINNAIQKSYEASQKGDYKVVVTETGACETVNELFFSITEPYPNVAIIPNIISPNGDGINDTWVIPQAYVSGTNTEVVIMSSQGKIILQTTDYQNNWPENQMDFKHVNPVYYYIITTANNITRKGSITVVK